MGRRLAITLVTTVGALTSAASALAGSAAPEVPTVALLPLVASGLAADEIGPIEATVRAAVEQHLGPRALPAKQVLERLEHGGAIGLRCDRLDPSCSAQLGAVCGVEQVLVASLATSGGATRLALRRIDVAEVTQLAHASRAVSEVVRLEEVRAVLRALDEPAAAGTSVLVTGPTRSLVVVDGEDRGVLPMAAPLTELAPGPHEIGVDGPVSMRRRVELRRGEPVLIEVGAPEAPRAAATPARSATASPRDDAGASQAMLVLAGGGVAAGAGLIAVVTGVTPLVLANLADGRLAEREARVRADPTLIESEAELIRQDHAAVVEGTAAWRSWGGVTTVIGGALVIGGLVVAVAGSMVALE